MPDFLMLVTSKCKTFFEGSMVLLARRPALDPPLQSTAPQWAKIVIYSKILRLAIHDDRGLAGFSKDEAMNFAYPV